METAKRERLRKREKGGEICRGGKSSSLAPNHPSPIHIVERRKSLALAIPVAPSAATRDG
jgi:hypothetical protein